MADRDLLRAHTLQQDMVPAQEVLRARRHRCTRRYALVSRIVEQCVQWAAEHSAAMERAIEILLVHEVVSLPTDTCGLFTLSDIAKISQLSTSISHVVRSSSIWALIFHEIRSAGNNLTGQRVWGQWFNDENMAVMTYTGQRSLAPFFAHPDRRIVERVGRDTTRDDKQTPHRARHHATRHHHDDAEIAGALCVFS